MFDFEATQKCAYLISLETETQKYFVAKEVSFDVAENGPFRIRVVSYLLNTPVPSTRADRPTRRVK